MDWQPIETAPTRKGVLVISRDDEGEWFYPVVAWNWENRPDLFNYEGWLAIVSERPLPFVPTHWMPVPPVPPPVRVAARPGMADNAMRKAQEGLMGEIPICFVVHFADGAMNEWVEAVFSTRILAEQWIAAQTHSNHRFIQEMPVDPEPDDTSIRPTSVPLCPTHL